MRSHDIWLQCTDTVFVKLSEVTVVQRLRSFDDDTECLRLEGPALSSAYYSCALRRFRKFLHLIHEEDQWLHCANSSIRLSAIYMIANKCVYYRGYHGNSVDRVPLPSQYLRASGELSPEGKQLLQRSGSVVTIAAIDQHNGDSHEK